MKMFGVPPSGGFWLSSTANPRLKAVLRTFPAGEIMQQIEQVGVTPVTDPQASPSPTAFDTLVAFLGLIVVDLIVKTKGFPYLYRIVKRWPVSRKRTASTEVVSRICASVDRACTYYLKQALCLQRSALTTCLLRWRGVEAQMVIGCRKFPFHGHAWVEVNGEVVNDKKEVQESYGILDRC
jgi:hypothetical protein